VNLPSRQEFLCFVCSSVTCPGVESRVCVHCTSLSFHCYFRPSFVSARWGIYVINVEMKIKKTLKNVKNVEKIKKKFVNVGQKTQPILQNIILVFLFKGLFVLLGDIKIRVKILQLTYDYGKKRCRHLP